jgi:hypothetical protein
MSSIENSQVIFHDGIRRRSIVLIWPNSIPGCLQLPAAQILLTESLFLILDVPHNSPVSYAVEVAESFAAGGFGRFTMNTLPCGSLGEGGLLPHSGHFLLHYLLLFLQYFVSNPLFFLLLRARELSDGDDTGVKADRVHSKELKSQLEP